MCRSPGFWGTHPEETTNVLLASGGFEICGANVFDISCAAEGLCSSPRGSKQVSTARHLLAAALNCYLTDGSTNCGTRPIAGLFASCNAACAANDRNAMAACAPQIECANKGGEWIGGMCAHGQCAVDGSFCGGGFGACDPMNGNTCEPFPGNCHENPLDLSGLLSEPPSRGDPPVCKAARKSKNNLFNSPPCQ